MPPPTRHPSIPHLDTRLLEPWHALALSCLRSTRFKPFQRVLSSFVPFLMSLDGDYAEAVFAEHFYHQRAEGERAGGMATHAGAEHAHGTGASIY